VSDLEPIGRDAEIAEVRAFLASTPGAPRAIAITGDAGIGKTIIWKHVAQAVAGSSRVLSCRAAAAERPLAFSGLDDLFSDVAEEVLPELPAPRRRAVEIALLRSVSAELPPAGQSGAGRSLPDRSAVARGFLDVLRILSTDAPLVIAVDDTQWLDRPSASVLEFCFRRLESRNVSVMLTFRNDGVCFPLGLDRALASDRICRVLLGPLSLGAIGEILRARLGAVFPRYTLTRLYDASGGNPFYALEAARALLDRPRLPRTNEPIPLPRSLSDLVRNRVQRLTVDSRKVGRLVAASLDPREPAIRAACGRRECWAAIDQAVAEGLLERDGDILRFTHPLLRSVLYTEMTPDQCRQVHQRLAATVHDVEERAWHLALGADRPSEKTAVMLEDAAIHAAARGAPETAAVLTEQAARLTQASRSSAVSERVVRAADYHFRAGDIRRSLELIQSTLATCPAGPNRAALLLRLATIRFHQSGWPQAEQTFLQAAREAPNDPALRAQAQQELAFARLVAGDLTAASRWAQRSLHSAEQAADPLLVPHSLARIALFSFLRGSMFRPDLLQRAEALAESAGDEPVGRLSMLDPTLVTALILKWCDRLDEARLKLADRYRHALDRGDEASLPFLLYHYSQLECWAGNWDAAEEYALEGCRVADENHQLSMRPATLYALALVRAHRGQVQDAQELAAEALVLSQRTGNVPLASQVVAVLGFVALSLDDYQAAHSHLARLADTATAAGLKQPSVVKFVPDQIEALIALGNIDLAKSLTRQLEERGKLLGRPWALSTSGRCRAYLAAFDGDLEDARAACEQSLSQHERLPMPFELARTLLIKGMIERRARQKSAARSSFGLALTIFERLGAQLWSDKTRRELSKIATRAAGNALTDTELQIAALVAQGQTNREVASAMFVTENTVQTHIRHIFRKLGLRSRTELAARLLSPSASAGATTPSPVQPARG
jgi:DNA-binding CsgD family transcriptional regulator